MRLLEESTALKRQGQSEWSGATHPAYRNMVGSCRMGARA